MKKSLLVLLLVCSVIFVGCNNDSNSSSSNPSSSEDSNSMDERDNDRETIEERLRGLTKDEYQDLVISAVVPDDHIFSPGGVIPLEVTVRNTGDESVFYVLGSSSWRTPKALFIDLEGLQWVKPVDYLGIATMDYVTKELEPGDEMVYTFHVIAIEPNDKFDDYTYEWYEQENGYIAETPWETIKERFKDLIEVDGSYYTGKAYFLYSLANEDGLIDPTVDATGYAETTFVIGKVPD